MIIRKNKILFLITALLLILTSCVGRSHRINILGTYRNDSMMGYEAVVSNGTISIYSITPFKRELYWYGTCIENEKQKDNKIIIISEKIDTGRNYDFFGGFGSFNNESQSLKKAITFYYDSLEFYYDVVGFNVRKEKLYKVDTKHSNDSNAEKIPELIPSDENNNQQGDNSNKDNQYFDSSELDNIV